MERPGSGAVRWISTCRNDRCHRRRRRIARIECREPLDSHRLIEEFMIAANVAAAEALERLKRPCMYWCMMYPSPSGWTPYVNFC